MDYVFYDPTFQNLVPPGAIWFARNPPLEHVDICEPKPSECAAALTFWLGIAALKNADY